MGSNPTPSAKSEVCVLSKEICWRCSWRTHREEDDIAHMVGVPPEHALIPKSERVWNQGFVRCGPSANRFRDFQIDGEPPKECPYELEHLLSTPRFWDRVMRIVRMVRRGIHVAV